MPSTRRGLPDISRRALLLDVPADGEDATPLGVLLPRPELDVEPEDLLMLPELIDALPAAEPAVVRLYHFQARMQHEIGAVLGCSQMTVSRLLRRAVQRMRAELVDNDPYLNHPDRATTAHPAPRDASPHNV